MVVDNGSGNEIALWVDQWFRPEVQCISLRENMGIAYAQNRGIEWCKLRGASHVLFLDHDSIPANDMVKILLNSLAILPCAGAVGPNYADSRRNINDNPFIRIVGLRLLRVACSDSREVLEVDHLIASGSLAPMEVLEAVGPMREDFFIDYVDIEWCLRAKYAGYLLYGVCAARMEHRQGDLPVQFLGREYLTHSPQRHYFHVRNALLIYSEPWVPLNWKLVSAWRLFLRTGFHLLVTAPRLQHLTQISKGILHGLLRRAGGHPNG